MYSLSVVTVRKSGALVNKADGASATCSILVLVDNVDGTSVDNGILANNAGGAAFHMSKN
jgi:hypothetical protein